LIEAHQGYAADLGRHGAVHGARLHGNLQPDVREGYRTYDLALAILHEEIEHEAWFSEFIGAGPSGGITPAAKHAAPKKRPGLALDEAGIFGSP
jgi:hypothetical protein